MANLVKRVSMHIFNGCRGGMPEQQLTSNSSESSQIELSSSNLLLLRFRIHHDSLRRLYFVPTYATTHSSLMSITFLIICPLGRWVVRLTQPSKTTWIQTSIQMVRWVMILVGLPFSIRMGKILNRVRVTALRFPSPLLTLLSWIKLCAPSWVPRLLLSCSSSPFSV